MLMSFTYSYMCIKSLQIKRKTVFINDNMSLLESLESQRPFRVDSEKICARMLIC